MKLNITQIATHLFSIKCRVETGHPAIYFMLITSCNKQPLHPSLHRSRSFLNSLHRSLSKRRLIGLFGGLSNCYPYRLKWRTAALQVGLRCILLICLIACHRPTWAPISWEPGTLIQFSRYFWGLVLNSVGIQIGEITRTSKHSRVN